MRGIWNEIPQLLLNDTRIQEKQDRRQGTSDEMMREDKSS